MAAELKRLSGVIIPQYLREDETNFEALKGSNGGINVNAKLARNLAKEPFTGSTTVNHTFTQPMREFFISNDGESDLTITINNMSFTVYALSTFDEAFEPFTQVKITTAMPYQAWGRA